MAPKKSTREVKVKRTKKEKDPNRPKRPKSGYFLFLDDMRAATKNGDEGAIPKSLAITEFSKEAGARWKALDDSESQKYKDKAAKLKKEYEKVIADYDKKKKEEATEE